METTEIIYISVLIVLPLLIIYRCWKKAMPKTGAGEPAEPESGSKGSAAKVSKAGAGEAAKPGSDSAGSAAKAPERKRQTSLDTLYAQNHGMWVCRYCETINDRAAKKCVACGK